MSRISQQMTMSTSVHANGQPPKILQGPIAGSAMGINPQVLVSGNLPHHFAGGSIGATPYTPSIANIQPKIVTGQYPLNRSPPQPSIANSLKPK